MEKEYRNPNHLITDIRPLAEEIAKENNSKLTGITIGTVAVQLRFAYNVGGNQWEMLFYHNSNPACSIVIHYLRQKCKNEDTIYGRAVAMVNRYYSLPVDSTPQ